LSKRPDWRLQVANIPAAITCTDAMAEKHPELAVTFMKGMIKVGRWAGLLILPGMQWHRVQSRCVPI
jgi:hypothetical protein